MEFKALVTRSIHAADESIRINIEGDESLASFKKRVYEALTYGDNRANTQMQRLFEDTSLTDSLSEHELQAVATVAGMLFPKVALPEKPALTEGVKFEFSKVNAGGESVTVQIHDVQDYYGLNSTVNALWEVIDSRLAITNGRELAIKEYLSVIDYETRLKVVMIIDLLYGRVTTDQVVQRLRSKELEAYLEEMNRTHADQQFASRQAPLNDETSYAS